MPEEYFSHEWSAYGENAFGLALAIIMNTSALRLPGKKWNHNTLPVLRDSDIFHAMNIYDVDSACRFSSLVEDHKEIVLTESDIPPEKKR